MRTIQIARKSLWLHNRGNQIFTLCVALLILLPVLLYNTVFSVMNQVEQSHRAVFGSFSDIYYDEVRTDADRLEFTRADLMQLLPGFYVQSFGTFSTVYCEMLDETKKLNMGYGDEIALMLADVTLLEGRLPKANNEIALTQGLAQLLGIQEPGETVDINRTNYQLCGIVQDFGHLWPKGEKQRQQKITPVNAFITESEAQRLMEKEVFVLRQLLIERVAGMTNPSENDPHLFANVNNSPDSQTKFAVPQEFLALMYVSALVMVSMVLVLNRRRLRIRIAVYKQLGLSNRGTGMVLCLEQLCLLIVGMTVGFGAGCGSATLLLRTMENLLGQSVPLALDWAAVGKLLGALLIGLVTLSVVFNLTAIYAVKEHTAKHYRQKRVRPEHFDCKLHSKSLAALTLLLLFSFSLIAYGGFYGSYFKSDVFAVAPGTLPPDYDFQFITRPLPAAPAESTPVMFTDTFEKIGATSEFVLKLSQDPAVKSVKAYRENNKMFVMLRQDQVDDYLDASDRNPDGTFDCTYLSVISNYLVVAKKFGFTPEYVLAGAEVLSYPPEVLKSLERSVVEGKIDLQKIASGEEVVLRVPAFEIEIEPFGEGYVISWIPVDPQKKGAYNNTTLRVGDTITLTGLLTDELLNGGITEGQLDAYRRYDTTVKIGAIIRNTDGLFPARGSFGRPYSLLTVSEGMDALGIPATYSTVSVYTNSTHFSEDELTSRITEYTADVPCMVLENWQADIKTYRVFNTLVEVFVTILLSILVLTTLVILTSQLLAKTQMSMKNYALLRINGLSFMRLLRMWLVQLGGIVFLGCLPAVPGSLALMQWFGLKSPADVLRNIFYYFPPAWFVYIFLGIASMAALASAPSLLYLWKRRDSILFDMD